MGKRNTTETVKLTPEVKEKLDEVNLTSDTLSTTVNDALDVFKRHKNKMEGEPAFTYGGMGGEPIIEVTHVEASSEGFQAIIDPCPLCNERHTHGMPSDVGSIASGRSVLSHKSSHCGESNAPDGYWLILTEKTEGAEQTSDGNWVPE